MWEVAFIEELENLLIGDFDIDSKPVEGLVVNGMRIDFVYWIDADLKMAQVGFSFV